MIIGYKTKLKTSLTFLKFYYFAKKIYHHHLSTKKAT